MARHASRGHHPKVTARVSPDAMLHVLSAADGNKQLIVRKAASD
jgi:hypothetical protein